MKDKSSKRKKNLNEALRKNLRRRKLQSKKIKLEKK